MENTYKISSIIDSYISGDWGNDCTTDDTPYPVYCVRGADIVPISNSQFNDIPLRYVSKRSFQTRCLQEGDIIIEKSGGSPTQSTGRVVYVSKELLSAKKNIVCSNFCTAFRVKEGWNAHYVFLYLQNVYNSGVFFNFEGKTSGLKNLMLDAAFKSIPIKKITIAEQTALAYSISAIDKKLSLNRQINDNLEAMAKQLYDYWFVQFDFPNEEGKPYKSSGGAMVWNEKLKREIPVGWSVKNLGQIATSYQQGLIRSNNQLSTDSKYGYLKMGDLDGKGQYTLQGLTRTNATNEEVDLYSLHKGDFLINVRNSKEIVGKTCLIGYVERNTLYNHMLVRLDFKDVSTFYMNLLFNSEFMYKALDGLKQGTTTVIALYQSDLYRLPILIPAPCVMERFLKITDSILDQKEIISHEIAELTKQRNELLPLLMNGQATVNYHLSVY